MLIIPVWSRPADFTARILELLLGLVKYTALQGLDEDHVTRPAGVFLVAGTALQAPGNSSLPVTVYRAAETVRATQGLAWRGTNQHLHVRATQGLAWRGTNQHLHVRVTQGLAWGGTNQHLHVRTQGLAWTNQHLHVRATQGLAWGGTNQHLHVPTQGLAWGGTNQHLHVRATQGLAWRGANGF